MHAQSLPFRWARPVNRQAIALPVWKRALDITCCLVALPCLGLATLFAAMVILTLAPGPIFFRQERVGYKGRRFKLYKFRTMHVGAATSTHQSHLVQLMASNHPMQKLDAKGDSRLIPGGWLLRASGLDELPQIINVLRGEMSIVGPRPCIPYEFEHYTALQRTRLNSAPGLTGLWQVSGKNRTTFDEMIRLDIRYSETKSLVLDCAIILRTIPALCVQINDTRKAKQANKRGDAGKV
jgi:exopolysaccharide production protein ExoY